MIQEMAENVKETCAAQQCCDRMDRDLAQARCDQQQTEAQLQQVLYTFIQCLKGRVQTFPKNISFDGELSIELSLLLFIH